MYGACPYSTKFTAVILEWLALDSFEMYSDRFVCFNAAATFGEQCVYFAILKSLEDTLYIDAAASC